MLAEQMESRKRGFPITLDHVSDSFDIWVQRKVEGFFYKKKEGNKMLRDAMEALIQLKEQASDKIEEINGFEYYLKPGCQPYRIVEPMPDTLQTHNLQGLIDFLECPDKPAELEKCFFHIKDYDCVSLVEQLDKFNRSSTMIHARFDCDRFPYDYYMDLEDFIIKVQCYFDESPEKIALIKLASDVTGEEIKKHEDNGIAQVVHVVDGLGRLEEKETSPITFLQPVRTFLEIKQPESPFLFRLKKVNGKVLAALFESDRELWKYRAVASIKAWIKKQPIVADNNIKVIG